MAGERSADSGLEEERNHSSTCTEGSFGIILLGFLVISERCKEGHVRGGMGR